MAQIANRDDAGRAAGTDSDAVNKTVDLGRDVANRTAEVAGNTAERAAGSMREAADRSEQVTRRMLGSTSRAAEGVLNVESDFAKLWLETAREQMQHNVETFQRLAGVRDWREAAEIQGAYVRGSLSRAAQLISSQLEVANAISARMLSVGREQARKVG
jgi:hypothetical protein